eukprot:140458-Pelagomonas_calceolata.AAC.3
MFACTGSATSAEPYRAQRNATRLAHGLLRSAKKLMLGVHDAAGPTCHAATLGTKLAAFSYNPPPGLPAMPKPIAPRWAQYDALLYRREKEERDTHFTDSVLRTHGAWPPTLLPFPPSQSACNIGPW